MVRTRDSNSDMRIRTERRYFDRWHSFCRSCCCCKKKSVRAKEISNARKLIIQIIDLAVWHVATMAQAVALTHWGDERDDKSKHSQLHCYWVVSRNANTVVFFLKYLNTTHPIVNTSRTLSALFSALFMP